MRFLLITIALFYILGSVQGQQNQYKVEFIEGEFEKQQVVSGSIDSVSFSLELLRIRNELFKHGHLLANIDEVIYGESYYAQIFVGPRYFWHSLGVNNIPEEYLSRAGYRRRDFDNRTTNIKQFNRLVSELLDQATNAGYPFANFRLTDIEVENNSVKGVLDYQSGPIIRYDSLTLEPVNIVKANFLEAYLNVKEDDLFSYEDVKNIESSVDRLPYARINKPVQVKFENNLCNILFGMEKIKSNRFDANIGFLPNQGSTGGLRITGFVDLHLDNLFRAGKSLTFIWQQFQSLSQNLSLKYNHPNLFRSPVGLRFDAVLLRQDTTFLNTDLAFNIFYARKAFEISFMTDIVSARQLSNPIDTTSIPLVGDFSMNLFGLNLTYDRIGNQNNPSSGLRIASSIKIGGKSIQKNPALSESVYDSLNLNPTQFHFKLGAELNIGLSKTIVFHSNLKAGGIWNNDRLFVNDLVRLGGLNTLRGFNEFDLYVSSYALIRFEMRLLMNEDSRLFLFYDQGITNNVIGNFNDTPLGFGAGIYLRTGGGDLQLIYALGVSQEQSLSLDQSKIHLGYVAAF